MSNANTNTSKLIHIQNIIKRRIMLVFLESIVMIVLFLFIPALSLNFLEAWVYSIVLFVSLEIGVVKEKEKHQKIIQGFTYMGFALIYVIPALDHRFFWSHVPSSIVIFGDILVVAGLYLYVLVLKENIFASATIEITTDQKVITTGPYSIVRHPMYLGALIILFGVPLALGSWWGLLLLIPFALIFIIRLLDEEKLLSENLPGYDEYHQKVRYRLIPLLW